MTTTDLSLLPPCFRQPLQPGAVWVGEMVLTAHDRYWELPAWELEETDGVPIPEQVCVCVQCVEGGGRGGLGARKLLGPAGLGAGGEEASGVPTPEQVQAVRSGSGVAPCVRVCVWMGLAVAIATRASLTALILPPPPPPMSPPAPEQSPEMLPGFKRRSATGSMLDSEDEI